MGKDINFYQNIIKKNRIPVLTKSEEWNKIFGEGKSKSILALEKKLSELISQEEIARRQLNAVMAEKKNAMIKIIGLSEEAHINSNPYAMERMKEAEKTIREINEKMEPLMQTLETLPIEIQEANLELLKETLKFAYKEIKEGKEIKEKVEGEISLLRNQLNELRLQKEQVENRVNGLYNYIHNLLGAEEMQRLDQEMEI